MPLKTPMLIIVMGTSGSGKSTVGHALGEALACPFMDADDLHPKNNVDKMSSGIALNDDDREPWLKHIRNTGFKLATSHQHVAVEAHDGVNQFAPVFQSCHQHITRTHHLVQTSSVEPTHNPVNAQSANVAVMACSSLKLVYRRLLRGTITNLSDPAALSPEAALEDVHDLNVVHVFLNLSTQLLEERMRNRKRHFMKLHMLYSQLDTLQKPDPNTEPGVVVVNVDAQTSTDDIVKHVIKQLKHKHYIV